jgi:hypothetical protein
VELVREGFVNAGHSEADDVGRAVAVHVTERARV